VSAADLRDQNGRPVASGVGALARVALAAIEADQVATRVAALEAVLARRNPS
jgi:hypothetical protein